MNATSALCLILGLYHVRRKDVPKHALYMIGAVIASTIFLIGYLTRHWLTGTTYFVGGDTAKLVYHSLLYSHMTLAVVNVPLIIRLLLLVKQERIEEHKRLARWTFPIWLYVSVTGIVVYVMLYHWPRL